MSEPLQFAGSCFGFGVRSSIPLDFVRDGAGARLDVTAEHDEADETRGTPLVERQRDGQPFIRVHERDDGLGVWFRDVGWFGVDPDTPSIRMPVSASGPVREARLWGLPTALCFIARGDLCLHGAAVEIDGGAIVLAAPGRFGKTTFASAFVQAGARLLSEDLSCCRLEGEASLLPGPAMLRIRHDVYAHLEMPRASAVGEDEERVFVAIDQEARGDGSPVPLYGVIFLREHDEPPRIERVQPQPALPDLWALSMRLPNDADRARCFGAVTALARAVPVWNLHRRLALAELPAVVELARRACAEENAAGPGAGWRMAR